MLFASPYFLAQSEGCRRVARGEGQLLVKLGVMLGGQIVVSFANAERKGRSCRQAAESTNCRLSGGKRAFDPTTFDIVERKCQLAINHTLPNQGDRSPFDLRLKEISHRNARFGANLRR